MGTNWLSLRLCWPPFSKRLWSVEQHYSYFTFQSNSIKLLLKNLNTVVKSRKIKMNQQYQQYSLMKPSPEGKRMEWFCQSLMIAAKICLITILMIVFMDVPDTFLAAMVGILRTESKRSGIEIFMMIERWKRRMVVGGLPSICSPKLSKQLIQ